MYKLPVGDHTGLHDTHNKDHELLHPGMLIKAIFVLATASILQLLLEA
jgi:hypothetical protein